MVTKCKLKKDTSSFFSCFYRWSLSCWTFWSWLSCGSAGKNSRWRNVHKYCWFHLDAGSFFEIGVSCVNCRKKRMQNGWFFTTCLAICPEFSIHFLGWTFVSHASHAFWGSGIQQSHGIPWVAHGLRLLLVNHFVASLWQPVGPVHLILFGGRDVSMCPTVKNWHIGITFETSLICLEVIKSGSVHRCEVFNGWRGKSRSVELEGRDLVSTEECTAKDFPAICAYDQVYGMQPQQQSIEYRYATALHWSLTQFTPATATWQSFFSAWLLSCLTIYQFIYGLICNLLIQQKKRKKVWCFVALSPRLGAFWIITWLIALRWMYILRIWWSALLLFSYWFLASCFFRPKLNARLSSKVSV